jgi:hypothetical protein
MISSLRITLSSSKLLTGASVGRSTRKRHIATMRLRVPPLAAVGCGCDIGSDQAQPFAVRRHLFAFACHLGRLNMGDQARSAKNAATGASRPKGGSRLASQPDAAGTATRLAAERLRRAHIPLQPLLKPAGLSEFQIDTPDARIGVASQVAFLELAAAALRQPLLGFKLARDFDLRRAGLLFYVAASSGTLGDALERVQRYSSIVNAGVVIDCATAGDLKISVRYAGVARHSDSQQMEFLVTIIIGICRTLTNSRLRPTAVRLAHRRPSGAAEFERFVGSQIDSEKTGMRSSSIAMRGSFTSQEQIRI